MAFGLIKEVLGHFISRRPILGAHTIIVGKPEEGLTESFATGFRVV